MNAVSAREWVCSECGLPERSYSHCDRFACNRDVPASKSHIAHYKVVRYGVPEYWYVQDSRTGNLSRACRSEIEVRGVIAGLAIRNLIAE